MLPLEMHTDGPVPPTATGSGGKQQKIPSTYFEIPFRAAQLLYVFLPNGQARRNPETNDKMN